MHLTVGRWVVEHRAVPMVDIFSYVRTGEEFIAHSWLAGVVFYLIEHTAPPAPPPRPRAPALSPRSALLRQRLARLAPREALEVGRIDLVI
jgi:hypothetical protein